MRRSSPPGQEEGPAAGPDEPPRGGRPRDHSLDDTILKATRRLLTRSGYSQMTIADIAAESGVSRPTIYRRWPGKFELVAAALDYGLAHAQDAYSAAGRSRPSGAYERFRLAVHASNWTEALELADVEAPKAALAVAADLVVTHWHAITQFMQQVLAVAKDVWAKVAGSEHYRHHAGVPDAAGARAMLGELRDTRPYALTQGVDGATLWQWVGHDGEAWRVALFNDAAHPRVARAAGMARVVTAPRQFQNLQRIPRRLGERHIARHGDDTGDIEKIVAGQCQQQRHGIVLAGVGIEDHGPAHRLPHLLILCAATRAAPAQPSSSSRCISSSSQRCSAASSACCAASSAEAVAAKRSGSLA